MNKIMSVYFDCAASSPIDPLVAKAIYDWQCVSSGNPSSIHHDGQRSRIKVEQVRDQVASLLHAQSKEILFTSGGTEANNLAIRGILSEAGRTKKRHVLISATEHPSVHETVQYLSKLGYEPEMIPVSNKGKIDLAQLKKMLRPETTLVSCMMINNETGIIYPVQEIAEICHQKNILFHCDAVQAFGKIDINLENFPADLLSFSAHKINGPKGIGGLFVREGMPLEKISYGGGQEANRRPGTENVSGIVGLGAALEQLGETQQVWERTQHLQECFEKILQTMDLPVLVIGSETLRSPYISSIAFPGIDNQSLLLNLDMHGLSASVGSACSSGSIRPSRVISAMGFDDSITNSAVRFSFGRFTTSAEIDEGLEIIASVLNNMQKA